MPLFIKVRPAFLHTLVVGALVLGTAPVTAQEPVGWGSGAEIEFHTFSIVAIDPLTGESGVTVTTRRPCVGNAVPWTRPGVGAVATQGGTRIEYGNDVLDLLEQGLSAQEALDRVVAADEGRENRQVGVIDMQGRTAQWTGKQQYGSEAQGDWVKVRNGTSYAVQGNSLVGPEVVDAVADTFEKSAGKNRHLADRMIEAIAAGQALGGDGRHGETQSAAVLVADPRPGTSRRPDQISVDINVCENPEPVAELRRIYNTLAESLGFRTLSQFQGNDIVQLKVMLHALGFFKADNRELSLQDPSLRIYDAEAIAAVDSFRTAQGWGTPVKGYVDQRTVKQLWLKLEEAGKAAQISKQLMEVNRVTR